MPGPVSDAYDPEWGTAAQRDEINDALQSVYDRLTAILNRQPPMDIRELVHAENLNGPMMASLTEKQWRLLRFSLERAMESL